MGYESVTPISALARAAIDTYLAKNPRAGEVALFPELKRPNDAASRDIAEHRLRRAEKKAGLPVSPDAFRRQFASERRHLPDVDVMAAAGWRSVAVTRRSYQHTDAQGVFNAIQRPPDRRGIQGDPNAASDNALEAPHIPVKNMM